MRHLTALVEILELVYELNDSTIDRTGKSGPLVFESSGFSSAVTLYGETVWDDDEYGAPWNETRDEQMPIREWFSQRIIEIMEEHGLMTKHACAHLRKVDADMEGGTPAAPATQ